METGFYVLAALTVIGGILAIRLPNPVHMVLALSVFFAGIAGLFLLLNAEFVAVVQVLIYIGAIAVLILFSIMLTRNPGGIEEGQQGRFRLLLGAFVSFILLMILYRGIGNDSFVHEAYPASSVELESRELGVQMLRIQAGHFISFEVISLLLTAALVGAIVIGMEDSAKKEIEGGSDTGTVATRPTMNSTASASPGAGSGDLQSGKEAV